MKFTNGYWLLKDEMTPAYAVEYGGHTVKGDELTVYCLLYTSPSPRDRG